MSKDELVLFTKGEMFQRYVSLQKDLKELETELDEQWKSLQKAMEANGVNKIDGEWGSITLAERTSYKASNISEVDIRYLKAVLDTEKVKAEATLTGQLPQGVEASETKFLTKRFK